MQYKHVNSEIVLRTHPETETVQIFYIEQNVKHTAILILELFKS